MGLLGKVFGLEKKGKITITVDKPSYVAGELVVGTIAVKVFEPIECDAVVLMARGKEWAARHEIDGITVDQEKEFFNEKIVISSIPNTYMPGNYSYPFEYQLPPDLPGVINLVSSYDGPLTYYNCRISYKLKASLEVGGFFAKDLKTSHNVEVHQQLSQLIQPSRDFISQQVNFLCCFNKGTCHLDAAMDKNVFFAGETAQILCNIQNQSQVDISTISCLLVQRIEIEAHGLQYTLHRELCEQRFDGVRARATFVQPQPLLLVPNVKEDASLVPSTTGRLVKCSYYVDIKCSIPWCPDVHLRLPVTIVAPIVTGAPYVPPGPQHVAPA